MLLVLSRSIFRNIKFEMMSGPHIYQQGFLAKKKFTMGKSDDSRKGNIDVPIKDLIEYINSLDDYFTTSSCSGRVIVVGKDEGDSCKKGCKWVVTSHSSVNSNDMLEQIKSYNGNMVLKFEPFILHVQCKDVGAAKKMQDCALKAGFRNSGSVFGRHGSITFAVRGTHGLEVPIADEHGLIVSDVYLHYIINKANKKMEENEKKIITFTNAVSLLKS